MRNAYGRQVDSFETTLDAPALGGRLPAAFIRAPRFDRLGADVEVLASHGHEPVLLQQGRVLAATFHPELTALAFRPRARRPSCWKPRHGSGFAPWGRGMKLPPFLLDQWLDRFKASGIRHDLASSTGPAFTFRELLELASEDDRRAVFDSPLVYCPAAGSEELRAGIAEMHGARTEDVIVTTGAAEALHILFFDAAEPGANVVVSAPGFPPTWTLPESLGLEVRRYHLRPENRFRIDLSEVGRLVDARTRLVLVTSPHNPTGAVLGETEQLALAELAASRGALFVSDEVYHPLYYETPGRTAASVPGTIVVGDFSKALCLSGLRLGYLIDADRARRERWLGARMHFTITSTTVGEALAVIALKNRDRIFSSAAARVAAGHAAFARSVERLSRARRARASPRRHHGLPLAHVRPGQPPLRRSARRRGRSRRPRRLLRCASPLPGGLRSERRHVGRPPRSSKAVVRRVAQEAPARA